MSESADLTCKPPTAVTFSFTAPFHNPAEETTQEMVRRRDPNARRGLQYGTYGFPIMSHNINLVPSVGRRQLEGYIERSEADF
jgi:hypothetical protein